MTRLTSVLLCTAVLLGCSNPQPTDTVSQPAPQGGPDMTGADAYMAHCAGCHETGLQGAPVVGDTAYWEHRSKLWETVVIDHAKTGYLDMPAKGGRPDLSDATIEAAVRYMLDLTHPHYGTQQ